MQLGRVCARSCGVAQQPWGRPQVRAKLLTRPRLPVPRLSQATWTGRPGQGEDQSKSSQLSVSSELHRLWSPQGCGPWMLCEGLRVIV